MDDALEPNVRLKVERDAYKLACERAGVCMSCVVQAPETYGCPDCMNTGWQQGDPYERIKQLEEAVDWKSEPKFDWNNTDGPARQAHVSRHAVWAGTQIERLRRLKNG
ncbi:hypothetical protein EN836_33305 [Mesorhizobium sp. M1C.F.Ca.ET.193.01.1.1]|uniref:hypothetical protein n=1 Tax=unclassified Mesorhizobium TaxID=325217 RepID=UPI000FD8762B|nr:MULTISPECIES: hypothetical protein [unclassified Mesorhizobium]TGR74479.1 hypothetical protein EN836_33305 [Mesorhizobium sp. M1C.F.Ca.ET.193.01.1.1]TGT64134.1 hypothetical protein EN809_035340 [Mesorhizobium sp. M2E.F.Ca.ET.166.01.1.1]TGV96983.1 hypothetical protein EN797_034825 [Mesorhizobium sp. M2E.F.Ca.ET.154.01.1.1]